MIGEDRSQVLYTLGFRIVGAGTTYSGYYSLEVQ